MSNKNNTVLCSMEQEELIRAKMYKGIPAGANTSGHFKGHSARESLNLLRVSLNRSLILPHIDSNSEEEMDIDEKDVREFCDQISSLHSTSEDNLKDVLEKQDVKCNVSFTEESSRINKGKKIDSQVCAASKELAIKSSQKEESLKEEHCDVIEPSPSNSIALSIESPLEGQDISKDMKHDQIYDSARKSSLSIIPCQNFPVLQDPPLCSSPKIDNKTRKSIMSLGLSVGEENASECPISNLNVESSRMGDVVRSSLKSTKLSPTESLAASLQRGLQIIDYHQRNSDTQESFIGLSFEHLALNSYQSLEKVHSGMQTLPEEKATSTSFLCSSCKKVMDANGCNLINDDSHMQIVLSSKTCGADTLQKPLPKVC